MIDLAIHNGVVSDSVEPLLEGVPIIPRGEALAGQILSAPLRSALKRSSPSVRALDMADSAGSKSALRLARQCE